MRPFRPLFAFAVSGAMTIAAGDAEASDPNRTPTPFDNLFENWLGGYIDQPELHFVGALGSGLITHSGGDHETRVFVQANLRWEPWSESAYYGGYILPVLVPAGVYFIGLGASSKPWATAGAAALQAVAITSLTTSVLKVVTGRPYPTHGMNRNDPARLNHPEWAEEVRPFAFSHYMAWPSGHTSASFAVAAALRASPVGNTALSITSYGIATGIGLGMIAGDRHWASDVFAGALLGQAIGDSIGTRFRAGNSDDVRVVWLPMPGTDFGVLARIDYSM